jgi:hypothetical protein
MTSSTVVRLESRKLNSVSSFCVCGIHLGYGKEEILFHALKIVNHPVPAGGLFCSSGFLTDFAFRNDAGNL